MAQTPNRTEVCRMRVTPAEKSLVEERARTAGLNVSEYLRREAGLGHFGRTDLRRVVEEPISHDRVRELAKRMPERNARVLARREEARERAREALARS